MQSNLKQHSNSLSDNRQPCNSTLFPHNNPSNTKEQIKSSQFAIPSSINKQKDSPSHSQLPKSQFQDEITRLCSQTVEANPKPNNDRQQGSFIPESDRIHTYQSKKVDNVIEIIDDDDLEEHKTAAARGVNGVVNEQILKNKQISNPLLSSSTSAIKPQNNAQDSQKFNENDKKQTLDQKNVAQKHKISQKSSSRIILHQKTIQHPKISQYNKATQPSKQSQHFKQSQHSKPQQWPFKNLLLPQAKKFQKSTESAHTKHFQSSFGKSPFSATFPKQPFFTSNNYSHLNRYPFYDYQRQMIGLNNISNSLMNYQRMNDGYYWQGNDRFGLHSPQSSPGFSYLFGQGDPMIGKNMLLINHSTSQMSGMKSYASNTHQNLGNSINNVSNTHIPHNIPQSLMKNDKFISSAPKNLFSTLNTNTLNKDLHNHINSKQDQQKKKQLQVNNIVPKENTSTQIVSGNNNSNNSNSNNQNVSNKDQDKKDVMVNVEEVQKKKKPQVIELLDSDDDIAAVNQKLTYVSDNLLNDYNSIIQSSIYQNKQVPYHIGSSSNFQRPSFKQFCSPLSRQFNYPSGKVYKEPVTDHQYLQKTKLIQKQHRQENFNVKSFSDNLTTEKCKQIEKLQSHKQQQTQQQNLPSLFPTQPNNDTITFYQNTQESYQINNSQANSFYQKNEGIFFPQQTMKSETYIEEKLIDLKKHLHQKDVQEQLKYLEQLNAKSNNQNRQMLQQMVKATSNRKQTNGIEPIKTIQKPASSLPPNTPSNKQISSTQHVKREVQKAFQKTRSRDNNKKKQSSSHNSVLNSEGKPTLSDERIKQITEQYRKMQEANYKRGKQLAENNNKNKDVTNKNNNRIQEEKESNWVFEWTPKLKKLRDISKRREYDSVILVGPQAQADLPRFITDHKQRKIWKAAKRAHLLRRLYKHCSQI